MSKGHDWYVFIPEPQVKLVVECEDPNNPDVDASYLLVDKRTGIPIASVYDVMILGVGDERQATVTIKCEVEIRKATTKG